MLTNKLRLLGLDNIAEKLDSVDFMIDINSLWKELRKLNGVLDVIEEDTDEIWDVAMKFILNTEEKVEVGILKVFIGNQLLCVRGVLMLEDIYANLEIVKDRGKANEYGGYIMEMAEIRDNLYQLDSEQLESIIDTDDLKTLKEILYYYDDNDSNIIWEEMYNASERKDDTYLNRLIYVITNKELVEELGKRSEEKVKTMAED